MPVDRSFGNVIITRNVSLAIEQMLIAPSTQTWSPTKLATLSNTGLPTGFRHLGAVVEDSVNLVLTREKFELQTGIPRVLQYSAVTGISGRLEAAFHSFSNRTMGYAMAGVTPVNYISTIYVLGNTAQSYTTVIFSLGTGTVAVGDVLVTVAATPSFTNTDNEAQVNSIGTGANTLTVSVSSPGFLDVPNTGWFISQLQGVVVGAGSAVQAEYHILGVSDTLDGYQIVHDIQKARSAPGDMNDGLRPTENPRAQGRWSLFGYNSSLYGGTNQLVVFERWWFTKN